MQYMHVIIVHTLLRYMIWRDMATNVAEHRLFILGTVFVTLLYTVPFVVFFPSFRGSRGSPTHVMKTYAKLGNSASVHINSISQLVT